MKLFKNIRQNLILEKLGKRYFLYAIGEIFLVMIGLSLAFQLDNWNENRIKKNNEINYYKNIKDQLEDDKELIQGQMHFNNRYMEEFIYANKIIESNDRTKLDTLGIIIRNMSQYSDFDRKGNIYETMVNSGEIKLLRNHDIVKGIRELEERYTYVNRIESIHYDAVMNHTVAVISPLIKYSTAEIQKEEDIFRYEFQNLLTMLMQVMKEKNETYINALDEIERVTRLIDNELLNN